MNTGKKTGFGCGILVLLAGLVVFAVIIGLPVMWFVSRKTRVRGIHDTRRIQAQGRVELEDADLPDYSTYQSGAPLSREAFVSWSIDPRRTSLAERVFREKAEGAEITWSLMTDNIESRDSNVFGTFSIPYSLKVSTQGTYEQNSTLWLRCEFTPESRDALLAVRRNDWVGISGVLSLKSDPPVIRDARLAGQQAEKH